MPDLKRRTLLKGSLGVGLASIAAAAGLLKPTAVFAAAWPEKAFSAKSVSDVMDALLGNSKMTQSKKVEILAPSIAENGAEVGISISTELPKVDSISLLVEKNPSPLAVSFSSKSGALSKVRTRLKLAKTTDVHAVVRSDGKLYTAKYQVKVTLGGCGG
jgi:sulfur-oxidizing protein SoxY